MEKLSGLFASMGISASGLAAQRRRMNNIAENIANIHTTRTPEGGPYRRKITQFHEIQKQASLFRTHENKLALDSTSSGQLSNDNDSVILGGFSGVEIETVRSRALPQRVYEPDHPDANEQGFVLMPKIDVVMEMVDMISASRAYEANVTAIQSAKDIALKALEI